MQSQETTKGLIAHVRRDSQGQWLPPHLLIDHLEQVSRQTGLFASKFDSKDWGETLGLAHDIGKAREEWQEYLRSKSGYGLSDAHMETSKGTVPHAAYGAKAVEEHLGRQLGRVLSYAIAGHHAGIPDWIGGEGTRGTSLSYQLDKCPPLEDVASFALEPLTRDHTLAPPWAFSRETLDMSLWIRMLFSCLVDADYLDTEEYMSPEQAQLRGQPVLLAALSQRLDQHYHSLRAQSGDTHINRRRNQILELCLRAADEQQGVFSLTVPTGGGKTLASLAFALRHALRHGLDRIIYVVPYTSIIEQTVDVFREALGHDHVVEHHSSLDEDEQTPEMRLAAENWDAPVIVTTTVQFLESLFSAKPSRCRKLHNICRSVVILDEAQLVPVGFLKPILHALQCLIDRYRLSLVISTATKPAFGFSAERSYGFRNVKEIIGSHEDVADIYRSLKRVDVEVPEDLDSPVDWEQLAQELVVDPQVLCVVSERNSCRELHRLMPEGTYHLSALMCGQHRSEVIHEIKEQLAEGGVVRVISTQLVEAGVDLDFPVVYRALAGLDSIAQAAGRCNREGRLSAGRVVVFVPPRQPRAGLLRKAAEAARGALRQDVDAALSQEGFQRFFEELYWKAHSLDEQGIMELLKPTDAELGLQFRTASKRFRMIDDSQQSSVIVRYGDAEPLIEDLRQQGPSRYSLRRLQRYTVSVYNRDLDRMLARGSIEEVHQGIYAMTSSLEYDSTVGLMVDDLEFRNEDFVI